MTPAEFIAKWSPGGPSAHLNEEQGAQSHFLDLCELLDVPKPGSAGLADVYVFEQRSHLTGAARGYADVYYRDHFAWENKAPGRNLDAALRQLQQYSLALANPPLLVVCDRLNIRIHTQFNGHPSEAYTVRLEQLDQPDKRALLRRLWLAPDSFRPRRTNRAITEEAAHSFANLAAQLRARGTDVQQVAHFLTQCVFCFFAEDIGLLPGRMFERLVNNRSITPEQLASGVQQLLVTMQTGGLYGADAIPWFNGGLFEHVAVPALQAGDVTELRHAAALDWSAIDVSIFGTLFERGLDPVKRSQLGAHYTDPATIGRIIEPVIQRPLLARWQEVKAELQALSAKVKKHGDAQWRKAHARFIRWLEELRAFRILDPACGSGNFLFLGLKALKDIEHLSITDAAALGLDREQDLVTGPHNVLGIELNRYAAELARASIWIGELQWRIAHGYPSKTNPVLEPLQQIECRDALLAWEGTGDARRAVEARWPKADVVVGNPPFVGDRKMIRELGEGYTTALRGLYGGRVPGGADLVCYWFEKSRDAVVHKQLSMAGLVATNSIRGGKNRHVLDVITKDMVIFDAWSDEPWVNEGAAVRVSLVCFGRGEQQVRLDGEVVPGIYADLTFSGGDSAGDDLTVAQTLAENANTAFVGVQRNGPFHITGTVARKWLRQPNPTGRQNTEVLTPAINAMDVTRRRGDRWLIDFDLCKDLDDVAGFELPFEYVNTHVRPTRVGLRRKWHATYWWLFGDPRPALRAAIAGIDRYLVTPQISKHRVFVFMPSAVLTENANIAIARADDVAFGVLQSRFHELWALAVGTALEDRPRYTNSTTFQTFPFPAGLTPAETASQQTDALASGAQIPADLPDADLRARAIAIAEAAHRLDTLRQNWLNPPEWTQRVPEVVPLGMQSSPYPDRIVPRPDLGKGDAAALKKRTLTQLYNQRPAWLAQAHEALDAAVAAAYGWDDYAPELPDEEILRRLLALNLQRAAP